MAIADEGELLIMYFEKIFEFKNGASVQIVFKKFNFDHWCNFIFGISFYKSDYIDLICYETALSLFKFSIAINVYRETQNNISR